MTTKRPMNAVTNWIYQPLGERWQRTMLVLALLMIWGGTGFYGGVILFTLCLLVAAAMYATRAVLYVLRLVVARFYHHPQRLRVACTKTDLLMLFAIVNFTTLLTARLYFCTPVGPGYWVVRHHYWHEPYDPNSTARWAGPARINHSPRVALNAYEVSTFGYLRVEEDSVSLSLEGPRFR
jgi:hypothetical protein